jgi:alkylated DNA repair dioxygenase AlkB
MALLARAFFMQKNIIPRDGRAFYHPSIFKSDELMDRLLDDYPFKQNTIKIFGKKILEPRLSFWVSDCNLSYTYSGTTLYGGEWSETLLYIKDEVEKIASARFNSALLNLYRDGQDYMGYHQDNEPELGGDPIIASVSLGKSRDFVFKHKSTKQKIMLNLAHGDLLIMEGKELQTYWHHALPKRAKVGGPRLNLTFRNIIT